MILIKYKKITNNIQTKIQEGISRAVAVSHIVWASRLNISPILSELFMTHLRQDISTICLQYFSNFERFFYHPPEARYSSKKYSNIQSNNIQTKIHVNIPGAPEYFSNFERIIYDPPEARYFIPPTSYSDTSVLQQSLFLSTLKYCQLAKRSVR